MIWFIRVAVAPA